MRAYLRQTTAWTSMQSRWKMKPPHLDPTCPTIQPNFLQDDLIIKIPIQSNSNNNQRPRSRIKIETAHYFWAPPKSTTCTPLLFTTQCASTCPIDLHIRRVDAASLDRHRGLKKAGQVRVLLTSVRATDYQISGPVGSGHESFVWV